MKKQTQWRFFTLVDCDREVAYLQEMQSKGWQLSSSRFLLYRFEECQPADVVYLLVDKGWQGKYQGKIEELTNRGWEVVRACPYLILRKPAKQLTAEEQSLIKDPRFRWELISSSLVRSAMGLGGGLIALLSIALGGYLSLSFLLLVSFYMILLVYWLYGIYRLRKKWMAANS